MATQTTCCVTGCDSPAVEFAAPGVPYCSRHAASNRASTAQMMGRANQPKMREVRKDGRFVRFPVGSENELPTGTELADGTLTQP
jgi:hypothetical protein